MCVCLCVCGILSGFFLSLYVVLIPYHYIPHRHVPASSFPSECTLSSPLLLLKYLPEISPLPPAIYPSPPPLPPLPLTSSPYPHLPQGIQRDEDAHYGLHRTGGTHGDAVRTGTVHSSYDGYIMLCNLLPHYVSFALLWCAC